MIADGYQRIRRFAFRPQKDLDPVQRHHQGGMGFAERLDRQGKHRVVKAGPRLIAQRVQMFLRIGLGPAAGQDHPRLQVGERHQTGLRIGLDHRPKGFDHAQS